MDFGKFKYETSKKEKASRKHQSTIVLKEIKLRPKTDEHDFDFKVKHIRRFLAEGNKCKLVIVFRGREIVHPETGQAMLDQVVKDVGDIAMVEQRPMMEGRRMVMVIGPRGGVVRAPARPSHASLPRPAPPPPHRARAPHDSAARTSRVRPRSPPGRLPRRSPPPPRADAPSALDRRILTLGSGSRARCVADARPCCAALSRCLALARDGGGRLPARRLRGRRRRQLPAAGRLARRCRPPRARRPDARSCACCRSPTRPSALPGPKALAGQGDYVLENDQIRVVLDAPEHPHFLAPSGGAILDLAPLPSRSGRSDQRHLPRGRAASARRRPLRERPDVEPERRRATLPGAFVGRGVPRPPGRRQRGSPS